MKGRQVLGKYPEDLTNEGPLILERGTFNSVLLLCCVK